MNENFTANRRKHLVSSPSIRRVALLTFLAGAPSMWADSIYSGTLEVGFHDCPVTQGGTGPVSASCASSSGEGQGVADYTSMGVMGSANPSSAWGTRTDMWDTLTVGGVPTGTTVDLTFLMGYSGGYSFSSGGTNGQDEVAATVLLAFNSPTNYIVDDSLDFRLCDPSLITVMSCLGYGSTLSGSTGRSLVSTTAQATAGVGIPLQLAFALFEDGSGTVSADFLDGLSLTDILVTDPVTGQPIAGATITSASGAIYPTNVNAVPEPSSLALLATAIFLTGALYRNRVR